MTCPNCHGGKPETRFQVVKRYLATKFFDRKASADLVKRRVAVCTACQDVVRNGNGEQTRERMLRKVGEKWYCGAPRLEKFLRFEDREGCGCDVEDKARYMSSACPRGRWGPGANFGGTVITVREDVRRIENLLDVNLRDIGGIGDIILTLPAVYALQAKFPRKLVRVKVVPPKLDWLKLFWKHIAPTDQDLLLGVGERVHYPFPPGGNHGQWDIGCSEDGSTRQQYFAKRIAESDPVSPWKISCETSIEDEVFALDAVRGPRTSGKKIVVIGPYAAFYLRSWPLLHWVKLQIALSVAGYHVIMLDGPGSGVRLRPFRCVKMWGQSPGRVAALLRNADLVIGNDSGIAHLAGILHRPTIVICGPTIGKVLFDYYETVRIVQANGECSGCWWQAERGAKPHCVGACELLHNLDQEFVLEMATSILSGKCEATEDHSRVEVVR